MLQEARWRKDSNVLATPVFTQILQQYYATHQRIIDKKLKPHKHTYNTPPFNRIYRICTTPRPHKITADIAGYMRRKETTPLELLYLCHYQPEAVRSYRSWIGNESILEAAARAPALAQFIPYLLNAVVYNLPPETRKQHIFKALDHARQSKNWRCARMIDFYRRYRAIRDVFACKGHHAADLTDVILQEYWVRTGATFIRAPNVNLLKHQVRNPGPGRFSNIPRTTIPFSQVIEQAPPSIYTLQNHPIKLDWVDTYQIEGPDNNIQKPCL